MSDARYKATRRYEKSHYYLAHIRFPKEYEDKIRAQAEAEGKSISAYVISCVADKIGEIYTPDDLIARKKRGKDITYDSMVGGMRSDDTEVLPSEDLPLDMG